MAPSIITGTLLAIVFMAIALFLFISALIFPLVALLFLLVSLWAYKKAFYSSPKRSRDPANLPDTEQFNAVAPTMHSLINELMAIPCEKISLTSPDGLRLCARYYHVRDGAPVEIQVHGYKSVGIRDFCGGNRMARAAGHNSLIIDLRAHGESEGKTISFGIKERYDVLTWIEYVNNRFGSDTEIILSGVSMGAATVLMASGLDLPDNVYGIMADCPYSSPWEIISKVAGDMGLPRKVIFPFAWLGARLYGGFNLTECSALSEVKHSRVPILLIHGDDDRFVPCEMGRAIAESNPDKIRFRIFEGAGHAISYLVHTEEYEAEVKEFIAYCEHVHSKKQSS